MGGTDAAMGQGSEVSGFTDLLFDMTGRSLPQDYPFALWEALAARIPQLSDDDRVGVLPVRGAQNGELLLLSRRSKLALRLPDELIDAASDLAGFELVIAGNPLALGRASRRAISHYPTLHAHLASGGEDEAEFITSVQDRFADMRINARLICGIRHTLGAGRQSITGYSLVVHDLKPEASVLLQCTGIGEGRRFGCGIFMPYKVITDLE